MRTIFILIAVFLFVSFSQAQENTTPPKTMEKVSIYPIPANKFFIVATPSEYLGGKIVITDIVGKQIKVVLIEDDPKIKILTREIPAGVYFVSIEYNEERVFTKRIVIDK